MERAAPLSLWLLGSMERPDQLRVSRLRSEQSRRELLQVSSGFRLGLGRVDQFDRLPTRLCLVRDVLTADGLRYYRG
jgi:hypothetical protein